MSGWIRVTRANPCPVCKKHDYCCISADGKVAYCMRVKSLNRSETGGGWIHRMDQQPLDFVQKEEKKQRPAVDMKPYLPTCLLLDDHAIDLGVSVESLKRLACSIARNALAFPMRDEKGIVCGVQYRAKDGKKWSEPGSKHGLFRDPKVLDKKQLVVVEGASDTAAAMTALPDEWIVGRPSCQGCVDKVAALLNRSIRLVIVADRDKNKQRPDGTSWNPGWDGAVRLAEQCQKLASTIKIIKPPGCKDAREWLASGRLTPRNFQHIVAEANYVEPVRN